MSMIALECCKMKDDKKELPRTLLQSSTIRFLHCFARLWRIFRDMAQSLSSSTRDFAERISFSTFAKSWPDTLETRSPLPIHKDVSKNLPTLLHLVTLMAVFVSKITVPRRPHVLCACFQEIAQRICAVKETREDKFWSGANALFWDRRLLTLLFTSTNCLARTRPPSTEPRSDVLTISTPRSWRLNKKSPCNKKQEKTVQSLSLHNTLQKVTNR